MEDLLVLIIVPMTIIFAVGLECLSSNLEELKEKELDYPSEVLGRLAEHLISGPDVFEIYSDANIRVARINS